MSTSSASAPRAARAAPCGCARPAPRRLSAWLSPVAACAAAAAGKAVKPYGFLITGPPRALGRA
eukprot:6593179-Prymnesium_polylepis.1